MPCQPQKCKPLGEGEKKHILTGTKCIVPKDESNDSCPKFMANKAPKSLLSLFYGSMLFRWVSFHLWNEAEECLPPPPILFSLLFFAGKGFGMLNDPLSGKKRGISQTVAAEDEGRSVRPFRAGPGEGRAMSIPVRTKGILIEARRGRKKFRMEHCFLTFFLSAFFYPLPVLLFPQCLLVRRRRKRWNEGRGEGGGIICSVRMRGRKKGWMEIGKGEEERGLLFLLLLLLLLLLLSSQREEGINKRRSTHAKEKSCSLRNPFLRSHLSSLSLSPFLRYSSPSPPLPQLWPKIILPKETL